MLERFTAPARQVVVLADEEARTLKHNYIGTEHILLGLLGEHDGVAAQVLESLDISLEQVRDQVVRVVGLGEGVTSGQIPFTPRTANVLKLALRAGRSLGHDYVGTEHILLGLVGEGEGVAARILLDSGADSDTIHNAVIRMLGASPIPRVGPRGSRAEPTPSRVASEPPAPPSDVELGWRSRPIALAALGASVLSRMAFDPANTGDLEPLEMQVLARLTLGPPDAEMTHRNELFDSLETVLACRRDDLHDAVHVLTRHQLVTCQEEQDGDRRISITAAGLSAVQQWLARAAALFGRWPPDLPDVDDATQ